MRTCLTAALAALSALYCMSCDSERPFRIESSAPASVADRGGRMVCTSTPCVMRVSRETCGTIDSSSGYIILEARSQDGVALRSMPIVTCDVTASMRLKFTFPSGESNDCGAVLYNGNAIVASVPCGGSLVK